MYEVKLTYFKMGGKYYTEGSYESEKAQIFEIHEEVREMKANGTLPGISIDDHIVHVEVPDHPDNHPRLII